MRRKVARVCGAATEISLNVEGDATSFEKGWVRRTVADVVVLAGSGNALQVADARAFCAGSIEVRCCVELPRNTSLAGGNTGTTYGVACGKKQEEDGGAESDVYIVDFQTGETPVKPLPALNEEVVDAFVDARGEQIVAVGDGAWVDNDTGFALLLANGQMSVGAVNDTGCIELLAISTPSTMSKRLSLSALLGKAVSAALQLVWVAQEKQLVVDFGTGCVVFKLEIDDEEHSANLTSNSTELLSCDAFAAIRRRRVMDLSECVRGLLKLKPTPSAQDLLDTARIALRRSWKTFEDLSDIPNEQWTAM
ncbi:hypothetical protein PF005_g6165 [Phytophthora fragariae]|uniref:Uncharacterized protein n=1 Tax=Phytophthora fragariae TaxID=53985 RepID=A0A6A3YV01_9STRA|nr:hypothetical protein PF005_g6165 [Phytophthora fragariae]KAE9245635.1 hypothetical protein PF004_g5158 [Phytophthora fragariae]